MIAVAKIKKKSNREENATVISQKGIFLVSWMVVVYNFIVLGEIRIVFDY